MPLILGKNRIQQIKGPYYLSVLKPINQGITMLLFGETHTNEYYTPCDSRDGCISMVKEFVPMLNEFAATYPTELYTEAFFTNYENDIKTPYSKDYENYLDSKIKKLKTRKRSQSMFEPNSIMDEFNQLYFFCFNPIYKHKCEYKNISWNYSDVRDTNMYGFDTLSKVTEEYVSMIDAFKVIQCVSKRPTSIYDETTIPSVIDKDVLVHIKDSIEHEMSRKYNNRDAFNLSDYLNRLRLILDPAFFIDQLLQTPRIKSQYDKMSAELKLIFTPESFIELAKEWGKYLDTNEFKDEYISNYSTLLELLSSFYISKTEDEMDSIAFDINSHLEKYDESEFFFIRHAVVAYTGCALDIYFILRSNKREKSNKLVVGYFGSNHSKHISTYFTHIIKTHTVLSITEGEGFIDLPDEIDLSYLTNTLSIRAGTKKRGKKKKKSIKYH
jgi:hypothetical protein